MENPIGIVLRRRGLDLRHVGVAVAFERRLAAISVVEVDEGVVGAACYGGGFDVVDDFLAFAVEKGVLVGTLPGKVELPYYM